MVDPRAGLRLVSAVARELAGGPAPLDAIARLVADAIPDRCAVIVRADDGTWPIAGASDRTGLPPAVAFAAPSRARGEVIGVVAVLRDAPLDELERAVIETIADHVALALDRDRLIARAHDKRSEARLRAAKLANRELEGVASSVAHDLRAPLRTIVGFSEALREDCMDQLDDRGRAHLRRLSDAALRMASLVDDLLGLTRVSRQELRRDRVDLGALAQAAATCCQRTEPHRAVDLVIAPDLTADGDRRLLAIALDNLIGNAWKFTSKRAHARIEVGAIRRGEDTVFYVRDNGAGFDMRYADKLFGLFQRVHSDDEFPGTGIGLATVARIIHRHEGHVWAEGTPDDGATFYFTLAPS
ncbi:MAG TPA: ATP-binding protein [Kofleriaceae bacterium]|nr:ATP-binding protein [Kofleriaceae bacterium]